jgi:AcrR family transcriptional regulator
LSVVDTLCNVTLSHSARKASATSGIPGIEGGNIVTETRSARPRTGKNRNPATQAAILEAAAEILQESGYGGFTIEAVARRSHAGRPTIYRWWPNKAALILELYVKQTGALMRPSPDTGPLRADLTRQIEKLWHFWKRTPCGRAFRALIAEAQAYPDALEQLREYALPQVREIPRRMFEAARDRQEIGSDANIEIALDMIYGFQWYRLLLDQLDSKTIKPAVDMLLDGLTLRSGIPAPVSSSP